MLMVAPSASGSSSHTRARIGSRLLARVEFTVAVANWFDCAPPLALSVDERDSESHFCISMSALYGPSLTSASARNAPMMQVIMLTWLMPREVASSTWLFCGSVAYAELDGGSARASEDCVSASVTSARMSVRFMADPLRV